MFFIIPTGIDYHSRRLPMVTFWLMGINTLIYLISLVASFGSEDASVASVARAFWLIPSEHHWYMYITCWFVHEGFFHLAGNMIYLFLFGSCVEDKIGRWQFILFYILGGLAADFIYIASAQKHFASEIPMGGASGAISACIAGFVILMRDAKVNLRYFIYFFFRVWHGDFWLPGWVVISFWFLGDVLGLLVSVYLPGHQSGVASGAHVGGFIGGLLLALIFKAVIKPPADEEPVYVRAVTSAPGEPVEVHLYDNGFQLGPITRSQARQMLALGSVSAGTTFWIEGMVEWRSLSEL